ncbi:MAG: O-antigen ligase family protein [Candidatus Colwellbacteria bacterium]|nr:O-antigen ligase family protein [Candidatus Colwellbacteria bacterium]
MQNAIRNIFVVAVFLFPLLYFKAFFFPAVYSHAVFIYFIAELLFLLYLWHDFGRGKITFKKSYITIALAIYIAVLFLTALTGVDFGKSFWSSYNRMTGIITWLHYFALFFVVSAVSKREDWKYVFRAIMLSGAVLALVSWVGEDGFNTGLFPYLKDGSFLGNNSYSGAYFLLAFFLSLIGVVFETKKIWKWVYTAGLAVIFFNPDMFNFDVWSGKTFNLIGEARASSAVVWIGLAVLGAIFAVYRFAKNKKLVAGIAAFLFIAILGVYVYGFTSILSGKGVLYDKFLEIDGPVRLTVWDSTIQGIKERPILGYGSGNFDYISDRRLDPKLLALDEDLFFDHPHNLTLDVFISAGVLGALGMFLIFAAAAHKSIKLYLKENKFYFLVIPLVLVLHFLQLQTFLEGPGSLLLVFIMLAFLASREPDLELKVSILRLRNLLKTGAVVAFIVASYLWVFVPTEQNLLYIKLTSGATVEERQQLLPKLKEIKVDPLYIINLLSDGFMRGAMHYRDRFDEPAIKGVLQGEFKMFLDTYESFESRYKDNFKFNFQYGKVINAANAVGVNKLEKGEEIIRRAITISDLYPHPYALLAFNLYFQERYDEALEVAETAITKDPSDSRAQTLRDLIISRALQPL